MLRYALGFAFFIGLAATQAQSDTTTEEKDALAAVVRLGGKATLDTDLPVGSRVTAKFETATDLTLRDLKKYPAIGAIQALDGRQCTTRGFELLKDLPNLRRLVLNVSGVTDKELEVIVECKNLRELVIPASGVTDAGVLLLAKLPRLEVLALSENPRITDKSMATIAGLERLQKLYLGKTSLTDQGLAELKPLEGLHQLHVAGTRVTAEAALKFADEMPNLRVVRR